MKNKRGDLATTLLVFLVVMVCAVALYSFAATKAGIVAEIEDVNYAQGAYLKANVFDFRMESFARESFFETYLEFLKNEEYSYINSGSKIYDIFYFDSLHPKLGERFEELFLENLRKRYDGEVKIEFENDLLRVTLEDLEFESNEGGYDIKYKTNMVYVFNFEKQGVIGFNRLYDIKNKCVSLEGEEEIRECYVINGINVEVMKVGEYYSVMIPNGGYFVNYLVD